MLKRTSIAISTGALSKKFTNGHFFCCITQKCPSTTSLALVGAIHTYILASSSRQSPCELPSVSSWSDQIKTLDLGPSPILIDIGGAKTSSNATQQEHITGTLDALCQRKVLRYSKQSRHWVRKSYDCCPDAIPLLKSRWHRKCDGLLDQEPSEDHFTFAPPEAESISLIQCNTNNIKSIFDFLSYCCF